MWASACRATGPGAVHADKVYGQPYARLVKALCAAGERLPTYQCWSMWPLCVMRWQVIRWGASLLKGR